MWGLRKDNLYENFDLCRVEVEHTSNDSVFINRLVI